MTDQKRRMSARLGDAGLANNAAERAIGGSKIRRKTVSGYKSERRDAERVWA